MREILFRGKAIDGNWCYGVPLVFKEDYVCMTAPHTYNKKVEANTVGQFTGLTDKNGKKIFQGDILEICKSAGRKYKVVVCWGNEWEKSAFVLYYGGTAWDYLKVLNDRFNEIKSYEVIGNIHDNPELLRTPQNDEVRE